MYKTKADLLAAIRLFCTTNSVRDVQTDEKSYVILLDQKGDLLVEYNFNFLCAQEELLASID